MVTAEALESLPFLSFINCVTNQSFIPQLSVEWYQLPDTLLGWRKKKYIRGLERRGRKKSQLMDSNIQCTLGGSLTSCCYKIIEACSANVVPRPAASDSPGTLVEIQVLTLRMRYTEPESLRGMPSDLFFTSPPGDTSVLTSENHHMEKKLKTPDFWVRKSLLEKCA